MAWPARRAIARPRALSTLRRVNGRKWPRNTLVPRGLARAARSGGRLATLDGSHVRQEERPALARRECSDAPSRENVQHAHVIEEELLSRAEMWSGSEEGSYLRPIDFCMYLNSRLESSKEEDDDVPSGENVQHVVAAEIGKTF